MKHLIKILSQFKQWFLSVVINSDKAELKIYDYYDLYFISFGRISFGKECVIYVKKEWRGLSYKFITYKMIKSKWIEQR